MAIPIFVGLSLTLPLGTLAAMWWALRRADDAYGEYFDDLR